jgi:hypothetical protein
MMRGGWYPGMGTRGDRGCDAALEVKLEFVGDAPYGFPLTPDKRPPEPGNRRSFAADSETQEAANRSGKSPPGELSRLAIRARHGIGMAARIRPEASEGGLIWI